MTTSATSASFVAVFGAHPAHSDLAPPRKTSRADSPAMSRQKGQSATMASHSSWHEHALASLTTQPAQMLWAQHRSSTTARGHSPAQNPRAQMQHSPSPPSDSQPAGSVSSMTAWRGMRRARTAARGDYSRRAATREKNGPGAYARRMWWFIGIILGLAGAVAGVVSDLYYKRTGKNAWFVLGLGGDVVAIIVLFTLFVLALLV